MAFAQSARSIPGAVATLGVSDRIAFLRRTYAHLGIALVLWAVLTAGIFRYATEFSLGFSQFALSGSWNWLLVMLGFIGIKGVSRLLAESDRSKAAQYAALVIAPLAEAIILQPLIWLAIAKFGNSATTSPMAIISQSAVVTLAIFAGLTATVFISKKDFSFLRGALVIGTFAAIGVILASMAFGFSLGLVFCGVMIVLMAGWILYQTSQVMATFPPTRHVAAALMLYASIATLFWYVFQMMMSLRER